MRSYVLSLIFKWGRHTEVNVLNGKFDEKKTWLAVAWEHIMFLGETVLSVLGNT